MDNTCVNCKHYRFIAKHPLEDTKYYIMAYGVCTLNPKWQEVDKNHYCSQFTEITTIKGSVHENIS